MNARTLALLTTVGSLVVVGTAIAQPNWQAQPTYGTQNLNSGFSPDPVAINLQAGGPNEVSVNGSGACRGYINNAAPDVDLNFTPGNYPLNFYVQSSADTTLVINDANGNWWCDDDSGDGENPLISFAQGNVPAGNYNIWVGNYDGTATPDATLYISEIDPVWSGGGSASSSGGPNWQAQPTYGTQNLVTDFQPDPVSVALQAGGPDAVNLSGANGTCAGYINNAAPDVDLNYTAGSYPLNIYVKSDADTTLVINDANGNWWCNDDANGRNPLVSMPNPPSGNYNIWVGNYDGTSTPNAQLFISEIDPVW